MRSGVFVLLVLLAICLAVPVPAKPAAAKAPPKPPLVVGDIWADEAGRGMFTVIDGRSGGRWVGDEKAIGLLHKGDHLTVYDTTVGPVGEAVITGRGGPEGEGDNDFEFPVRVTWKSPGRGANRERPYHLLAVGPDGAPRLTWVKITTLPAPAKDSPYHRLAVEWLRARKWSAQARNTLEMRPTLRADVNGDGKGEVFVSFFGDDGTVVREDPFAKKYYSYILMRSLGKNGRVRTAVLEDANWPGYEVDITGMCDFDGDGWAEIISNHSGTDGRISTLYRWNGHGFVNGYGWGAQAPLR